MNIGFDAKRYFHNTTGLGNYSRDLVDGIALLHPENRYILFDKKPKIKKLHDSISSAAPSGSGFLWRECRLSDELSKYGIDVYHGLSNELPFGSWPKGIGRVVTVHDVIFKRYPSHYPFFDRQIYNLKTAHALKVADVVVATSETTKDDILRYYKTDKDRIKVVYQTCGLLHQKDYSSEFIEKFRVRVQLPSEYILYVSSFQHRKNHLKLIEAFAKTENRNMFMVLCGRRGETSHDVEKLVNDLRLNNRVRIINDLSADELPLLYRAAKAFVYPSMTEGFGIPLIEAANAGLPILVNDTAIFRELAPKDSLIMNVEDNAKFARAIDELESRDKQVYAEYISRFSTNNQVDQLMAIYKQVSGK